jgi:hypothetical protein
MLIKNHYERTFGQQNSNDQYKGRDLIVPNFSFLVSRESFVIETSIFFKFLKFCKKNKNIKFLSYEDLYLNSLSKNIFGNSIDKSLLDKIDNKLNYVKEKSLYIENYQEVHSWIVEKIKGEKLEDICDLYGIKYQYE